MIFIFAILISITAFFIWLGTKRKVKLENTAFRSVAAGSLVAVASVRNSCTDSVFHSGSGRTCWRD